MKLRPIDDGKDNGVNDSFCVTNKLTLHDVDVLGVLVRVLMDSLQSRQLVVEDHTYDVNPAWGRGDCPLPWPPARSEVCLQTARDEPSGQRFCCGRGVFTGIAVYAFNRVAMGLWWIACTQMLLFCTDHFDDFPTLECEPLAVSSRQSFETLLSVLGWRVSEGEKSLPFSATFEKVLEKIFETLVGRLQFARGQLIGHALVPALSTLYRKLQVHRHMVEFSIADCRLVRLAIDSLQKGPPRVIRAGEDRRPIRIYTDGASEENLHSVGAVVMDPTGNLPLVLSAKVPDCLAEMLLHRSKSIIAEVELLAIVRIKILMAASIRGKRVVYYIDNEGARMNLICVARATGRVAQNSYECSLRRSSIFHHCHGMLGCRVSRIPRMLLQGCVCKI
eukprot:6490676-Amphidinium_carterae.1